MFIIDRLLSAALCDTIRASDFMHRIRWNKSLRLHFLKLRPKLFEGERRGFNCANRASFISFLLFEKSFLQIHPEVRVPSREQIVVWNTFWFFKKLMERCLWAIEIASTDENVLR